MAYLEQAGQGVRPALYVKFLATTEHAQQGPQGIALPWLRDKGIATALAQNLGKPDGHQLQIGGAHASAVISCRRFWRWRAVQVKLGEPGGEIHAAMYGQRQRAPDPSIDFHQDGVRLIDLE